MASHRTRALIWWVAAKGNEVGDQVVGFSSESGLALIDKAKITV